MSNAAGSAATRVKPNLAVSIPGENGGVSWEVDLSGDESDSTDAPKSPIQRRLEKRFRSPRKPRSGILNGMPPLDLDSPNSPVYQAKQRRQELLTASAQANAQRVARAKTIARRTSEDRAKERDALAASIEGKLQAAKERRYEVLADKASRATPRAINEEQEELLAAAHCSLESKLREALERRENEFERRMQGVRSHLRCVKQRCDQLRMVRRMQSWWREATLRKKTALRFKRSGPLEKLKLVFKPSLDRWDEHSEAASENDGLSEEARMARAAQRDAAFEKLVAHMSDHPVLSATMALLDSFKPNVAATKTTVTSARSFLASLMVVQFPDMVLGVSEEGSSARLGLRRCLDSAAHSLVSICLALTNALTRSELCPKATGKKSCPYPAYRRIQHLLRLVRCAHIRFARAFANWKRADALCLAEELLEVHVAVTENLANIQAMIAEDEANCKSEMDPGLLQHSQGNKAQLQSIESRVLTLLGSREYKVWMKRSSSQVRQHLETKYKQPEHQEQEHEQEQEQDSAKTSSQQAVLPPKPRNMLVPVPSNEAMVHELMLDDKYELSTDTLVGDETAAMLDDFSHELEQGRFQPFLDIVDSIRQRLGALTPNRKDLLRHLDDRLDCDLLKQMMTAGNFDVKALYSLVQFIGEQILALQAPARQSATEAWLLELHESSLVKHARWTRIAPRCLDKALRELAFIDVDMANYHLRLLQTHLKGSEGIGYLQDKFAKRVASGEYQRGSSGMPKQTELWLLLSWDRILASREAAREASQSATAAVDAGVESMQTSPPCSPRLSARSFPTPTLHECLADAWMSSIFSKHAIGSLVDSSNHESLAPWLASLPETLREFDADRLLTFSRSLHIYSTLAVVHVTTKQVLGVHERIKLGDHPTAEAKLFTIVQESRGVISQALCDQVLTLADQISHEANGRALSTEARPLLETMIMQAEAGSPLSGTVRRQFENIIRKALRSPAHSCEQLLKKISLDAWKSDIFKLCQQLLKVFELNQNVHAPTYQAVYSYIRRA